jgi:hypothetical protein
MTKLLLDLLFTFGHLIKSFHVTLAVVDTLAIWAHRHFVVFLVVDVVDFVNFLDRHRCTFVKSIVEKSSTFHRFADRATVVDADNRGVHSLRVG